MTNDLAASTALNGGSMALTAKAKTADDLIPFTLLASELRPFAEAAGKRPPGYRQIYAAFLDGKFEAEKIGVSRHVRRADLPLIAKVMGLTPDTPVKAPRTRRSALAAASATA